MPLYYRNQIVEVTLSCLQGKKFPINFEVCKTINTNLLLTDIRSFIQWCCSSSVGERGVIYNQKNFLPLLNESIFFI
jgi:hypothetical protein